MPAKSQTKKEHKAFAPGTVSAQLVEGERHVGKLMDNNYKRITDKDGRTVAQVSDRRTGAVLERLPSEIERLAGKQLKESGKGGTGRYVVGPEDVDKARKLILAAHKAHVKQIEEKKSDKPKLTASKPSGKRARARGGKPAPHTKVVA
jgi:hypothetical protein